MQTIVKKIGKKTYLYLLALLAFAAAFFIRLFLGNSHINLSQLESKTGDVFGEKNKIISEARADAPVVGEGGCEGGTDGCSSGGSEGGEGEGEGGSDGGDY